MYIAFLLLGTNKQQTTSTIVSPVVGSGCEPSITTVNGKPTCKGYQIFNEDFNNDLTQWQNVVEIPTDKEVCLILIYNFTIVLNSVCIKLIQCLIGIASETSSI